MIIRSTRSAMMRYTKRVKQIWTTNGFAFGKWSTVWCISTSTLDYSCLKWAKWEHPISQRLTRSVMSIAARSFQSGTKKGFIQYSPVSLVSGSKIYVRIHNMYGLIHTYIYIHCRRAVVHSCPLLTNMLPTNHKWSRWVQHVAIFWGIQWLWGS